MNINFLGPVFPTDPYAQMAFVEILNTLLVANNIMEVNRMLIHRNANPAYGSLSGYFRWSYAGNHFTRWQGVVYNTPGCFEQRILRINRGMLASGETERERLTLI